MTEKRFKIDDNGVLIDTLTTETFKTVEDVVDILNYYENSCLRFEKRIRELKDNNKETNHISHGNLSEEKYKGSYGYYTDSKTDEMIRDLLEHKPFNCSDRIKSDRYD